MPNSICVPYEVKINRCFDGIHQFFLTSSREETTRWATDLFSFSTETHNFVEDVALDRFCPIRPFLYIHHIRHRHHCSSRFGITCILSRCVCGCGTSHSQFSEHVPSTSVFHWGYTTVEHLFIDTEGKVLCSLESFFTNRCGSVQDWLKWTNFGEKLQVGIGKIKRAVIFVSHDSTIEEKEHRSKVPAVLTAFCFGLSSEQDKRQPLARTCLPGRS